MAYPLVYFACLKLPEPTDLVSGHLLGADPGVHGVLGDAKMHGDLVGTQPRLGHDPPSIVRTVK